jgi:hypothetical protein
MNLCKRLVTFHLGDLEKQMPAKKPNKSGGTAKQSASKRTLNPPTGNPAVSSHEPFSEQDPKRRSGRFTGKGEITRGGIRGK